MSIPGLLQIALYVVILFLITKPVGLHLWRVFSGERTFLDRVLGPLERLIYRLTGVDPEAEQGWKGYAFAMLIFSVAGAVVTYAIERLQNILPFNPQGLDAVCARPGLQHRHVSFTTNTNWQFYVPETHDELLHPDGGAGLPQLGVGGGRHRHRRGARAWSGASVGPVHRQLLGGPGALHAVRAAADLFCLQPVPGLAGRAAEPE